MSDSPILENIDPKSNSAVPTAAQISGGIPIPAVRLLQVMSSDEWEGFTEEWLSFHKANGTYQSIRRFSGPGDLGLDIVAFTAKEGFAKPWDGYRVWGDTALPFTRTKASLEFNHKPAGGFGRNNIGTLDLSGPELQTESKSAIKTAAAERA